MSPSQGADITIALQTAFTQHTDVTIAPGSYKISGQVSIPSRRTLNTTGVTLIIQGIHTGDAIGYTALQVNDNANDVTFNNLTLQGLHTGGWTNSDIAALHLGNGSRRVKVLGCTFNDLVGFSVHQESGFESTVQNCTFSNCGNGVNVNADGTPTRKSVISDNIFTDSEGIESAGAYTLIERNTLTRALAGGISAGGNTSGKTLAGIEVRNNVINGVSQGSAIGISVKLGCDGAIIDTNTVNGCAFGIEITNPGGYPTLVRDTHLTNNMGDNNGVGLYLQNTPNITGTVVTGDKYTNSSQYGLNCESPNVTLDNSEFHGTVKDVVLASSAVGTVLNNCVYTTIQDNR